MLGGNTKIEIVNYEEDVTEDFLEYSTEQEEPEKIKIGSNELMENPAQEEHQLIIDNEMAQIEFIEDTEEPTEEYYENDANQYYTVDDLIDEEPEGQLEVKPNKMLSYRGNNNNTSVTVTTVHCCTTCGKFCKNASALKTHEKIHQDKPKDKKFQCDLCGDYFAFKSYIYRHMNYIHINEKK